MSDRMRGPVEDRSPTYRTVGVSPKLIAAVVAAVITYVLGQSVLELPPVAVVVGQAVLVAIAAWVASPGQVIAAFRGRRDG